MQEHARLRGAAILGILALGLLLAWPAAAASRIEKDLALAPGGRFDLDTDAGSVTVHGSSRTGVHVVITSPKDDIESRYSIDFRETPGVVEVTTRGKGAEREGFLSWLWGGRSGLDYEIEVPEETSLIIDTAGGSITVASIRGEVRLDTSGGSIRVSDVRGPVAADTSGGSISIDDVKGAVVADTSGGSISLDAIDGSARVDTSGGSIRARDVSGDLDAETSGGSINIEQAGGRVDASTSGGSVFVGFTPGNSRGGSVSSTGGGVRVALDPAANLEIDAQASGGSVSSALDLTVSGEISRGELRGRLGSGGERLELEASGGSIRIEAP